MLLAGDVGGTKTLLGLFEVAEGRPVPLATQSYATNSYNSFVEILDAFAREIGEPRIRAAAVGVAGPVVGGRARLTNIIWDVAAAEIGVRFETSRVALLNDLEAMANSVGALGPNELAVLQEGRPRSDGNAAVIAAGTGLGQAYLHRVDGRLRPVASEGGHADFAARSDTEIALVRMLRARYGRAEVEHVLSGPGLLNLHRFTHDDRSCPSVEGLSETEAPAGVSMGGLTGSCPLCIEALALFVSAYGAEAGNLALRGVATAGVFVGGGIAPKILPALQNGRFLEAFRDKPPMAELLSEVPLKVILTPDAGLLGAALHAQMLADAP